MPAISIVPLGRCYSASEWSQKQTVITQLYRDSRRSLKEVRVILAQQHELYPT